MSLQKGVVNGVTCIVDSADTSTPLSDLTGDGGDIIASNAAYLATEAVRKWVNAAYVDATNGNDSTAILGRLDKPYATISAAASAALAVGGTWRIEIFAGDYTDTGLVPGDSDTTLAYYYHELTTHTITGSGHLYDWTGDHSGKILYILGRCRFLANGSTTGKMINTNFSTTKMAEFHIECQDIVNASGRAAIMLDIRSNQIANNGSTIIVHDSLDHNSGTNNYLRIDTVFCYVQVGGFIRGLDNDGNGNLVIRCGYGERFRLGVNDLGYTTTTIFCAYRLKATGDHAILIRRGTVYAYAATYQLTGGTGNIIQIPSNANTSEGVNVEIFGGVMRQWSVSTGWPINFAAVNANFKVRLHHMHILVENSSTVCINAAAAQTIEAIGSLTSNVALDSDITVRGATPVIDAAFWTGF